MMKKLLAFCIAASLSACSNFLAEEEEMNSENPSEQESTIPMTLQVRSSPQETINYPVHVYIFDRSGKEVRHNEITSSKQSLDVKLPAGEYQLSTFTGIDPKWYRIPEQHSLTTLIEAEVGKPIPTPIQYGHTSFNLQKKSEVAIHLAYIVSSLDFKFQEIPSDVRSVEVGISPTSHAFSLGGSYSNDNCMTSTKCQHVGNEWVAGPVYILPSTKAKTTLTLFLDRPSGKESLSYTYTSTLEPCQPYCFSGRYNDGISLGGTFEVEGWKPGINVDFDFTELGHENLPDTPGEGELPGGEGGSEGNDTPGGGDFPINPSSSVLYCDNLPQAGDFYQDFYIWKTDQTTSDATSAVVISKMQWFNILAANAPTLLAEYDGLGLTGWRVFTKEEAKEFNAQFTETLPALNGQLRQHDQDEFYYYNGERYLCNNCLSTFCVRGSNRVSTAGQKQTYYLRAIKDVTFKRHS